MWVNRVDCDQRGDAGERQRGSLGEIEAAGLARDEPVLGHGDVLGPGAFVHGRPGEEAEDVISDLEAACVRAELLDRPREVTPGNGGKLVLHHSLRGAPSDQNVDPVHRRRVYPDEEFVRRRLGPRQVVQSDAAAVVGHGYCSHLVYFRVNEGRNRQRAAAVSAAGWTIASAPVAPAAACPAANSAGRASVVRSGTSLSNQARTNGTIASSIPQRNTPCRACAKACRNWACTAGGRCLACCGVRWMPPASRCAAPAGRCLI